MEKLYQPRAKYRPRFFSPLGWMLVGVLSFSAVVWLVTLVWALDILKHS